MTFTEDAWQRVATIRAAIDELPFLTELEQGSLASEVFVNYMAQDAHYLAEYSGALAACARQADRPDEVIFWARAAAETIEVERALHETRVADFTLVEPSPTTVAYSSYMLARAGDGSYPVLAASVLPCFWIYDDVGTRLKARVGELTDHPYGDWIGTYGDPDFAASTARAREIVDALAAGSDQATVERMHAAFRRATQYEWMFWDTAYRLQAWPV